jgi:hypothetical protein
VAVAVAAEETTAVVAVAAGKMAVETDGKNRQKEIKKRASGKDALFLLLFVLFHFNIVYRIVSYCKPKKNKTCQ